MSTLFHVCTRMAALRFIDVLHFKISQTCTVNKCLVGFLKKKSGLFFLLPTPYCVKCKVVEMYISTTFPRFGIDCFGFSKGSGNSKNQPPNSPADSANGKKREGGEQLLKFALPPPPPPPPPFFGNLAGGFFFSTSFFFPFCRGTFFSILLLLFQLQIVFAFLTYFLKCRDNLLTYPTRHPSPGFWSGLPRPVRVASPVSERDLKVGTKQDAIFFNFSPFFFFFFFCKHATSQIFQKKKARLSNFPLPSFPSLRSNNHHFRTPPTGHSYPFFFRHVVYMSMFPFR